MFSAYEMWEWEVFMSPDWPEEMLDDIEKFLSEDHTRPAGKDVYPEVFHTNLFFPLQRSRELAEMICTARAIGPRVVMEIGADKGGGLYHWCKCLPSVKQVIACEIRGVPYWQLFERTFPSINFKWLPVSSYESVTVQEVARWLPRWQNPIDILFIDGDKTRFDLDFRTYLPLMSSKGIVFFHDIQDREPKRSYEKVIREGGYSHREILDTTEVQESLDRERQGLPPTNSYDGWLRHWHGRSCGVGVVYLNSVSGV